MTAKKQGFEGIDRAPRAKDSREKEHRVSLGLPHPC
jgi:hypothetical protein